MKRILDYLVHEVSLVDEGAVQEKFLLLKSKGGNMSLFDKLKSLEIDKVKLEDFLSKGKFSDEEKELIEGFMKVLKVEKSEDVKKIMASLIKESDLPKEEPPVEPPIEPPVEPPAEPSEEVKKALVKEKEKQELLEKEKVKLEKEKEKLEKENKELKDKEEKAKFLEQAKTYKKLSFNPEKFADVLRVAKSSLPDETFKEIERIFKSADAALELNREVKDIYGEIGTDKGGGDLSGELEKLILEKMKDKKISRERALVQVMKDRPEMIEIVNKGGK